MLLLDGRLPVLAVVLAEARVVLGLDVRLFGAAAVRIRFVIGNRNKLFLQLLLFGIVETRNNLKVFEQKTFKTANNEIELNDVHSFLRSITRFFQ